MDQVSCFLLLNIYRSDYCTTSLSSCWSPKHRILTMWHCSALLPLYRGVRLSVWPVPCGYHACLVGVLRVHSLEQRGMTRNPIVLSAQLWPVTQKDGQMANVSTTQRHVTFVASDKWQVLGKSWLHIYEWHRSLVKVWPVLYCFY